MQVLFLHRTACCRAGKGRHTAELPLPRQRTAQHSLPPVLNPAPAATCPPHICSAVGLERVEPHAAEQQRQGCAAGHAAAAADHHRACCLPHGLQVCALLCWPCLLGGGGLRCLPACLSCLLAQSRQGAASFDLMCLLSARPFPRSPIYSTHASMPHASVPSIPCKIHRRVHRHTPSGLSGAQRLRRRCARGASMPARATPRCAPAPSTP